jgi:hypothetical protein
MIPVVDIAHISEELHRVAEELELAYDDLGGDSDTDPTVLLKALDGLLDGLRTLEGEQPQGTLGTGEIRLGDKDIHALGEHGMILLSSLSALAGRLRRPQEARTIEGLALPFACWISRQGGEIATISPAVNGAAALANTLKQSADLEQLYGLMSELVNAVSPLVSQDTSSTDPTRPWRVLLVNRAIVATRSHHPALMNEAFQALIEHLPQEASEFFREGMEQMDALDYPAHVRRVMEAYYEHWCEQRVLH